MRSVTIELGRMLTEEEVVNIVKNYITVDVLRSMRLHGTGIPFCRDGMGFVRYHPADVYVWLANNLDKR